MLATGSINQTGNYYVFSAGGSDLGEVSLKVSGSHVL